jgi:hypothetical protein
VKQLSKPKTQRLIGAAGAGGAQISYVCELQSGTKHDSSRSQDVVALVPNHPSLERFSAGDTVRVS